MRITKKRLANRFATLAGLLGWDAGTAYRLGSDAKYRAHVGATFLEHNTVYGYSINRIVNDAGGESRLKESCSAAEMDAWLGGAIFAASELQRRAAVSAVPLGSTQ